MELGGSKFAEEVIGVLFHEELEGFSVKRSATWLLEAIEILALKMQSCLLLNGAGILNEDFLFGNLAWFQHYGSNSGIKDCATNENRSAFRWAIHLHIFEYKGDRFLYL